MLTVVACEVVLLPATSVATAVSWCVSLAIFGLFQRNEYGLVVTVASLVIPVKAEGHASNAGRRSDPVPRSTPLGVTVILEPWLKLDPEAGEMIRTVGVAALISISRDFDGPAVPSTVDRVILDGRGLGNSERACPKNGRVTCLRI